MGARLLRRRLAAPLVDLEAIDARLDEVEALLADENARALVRDALGEIGDIERLANRVTSGYANPRELLRLRDGLAALPAVENALTTLPAAARIDGLAELVELISGAIAPDAPAVHGALGVIRPGHSPELDAIHASVADARAWIAALEATERGRTGLKSLKVGYNRVFGYYLEVPRSAGDDVPDNYIRRQTLVGAERYVTAELKERESEVLSAEERIQTLERSLFQELMGKVAGAAPRILAAADEVARIDVAASLAELARQRRYCRPRIDHSRALVVEAGRHPVVEEVGGASPFVPTDLRLEPGQTLLLTGPNMAGKSTVLRQTAVMVVMAQMGSFVPAASARIGLADRVFTRIGARDDLASGQSTFMVEMVETARILQHATARSVVILDELGRGTSTYDGMAIAWAVLEALQAPQGPGCRTLFATHYHELTALEARLPGLANVHMAVADTSSGIAFLHRVDPGPADRSYGIHVAELAGVPRAVTARAWELLARLEQAGAPPFQSAENRPAADATGQLALFEPAARLPAWAAAVADIDVERMTPLEAMNALAALVARARGDVE
jgi:DNA mismatch repair protein MutS